MLEQGGGFDGQGACAGPGAPRGGDCRLCLASQGGSALGSGHSGGIVALRQRQLAAAQRRFRCGLSVAQLHRQFCHLLEVGGLFRALAQQVEHALALGQHCEAWAGPLRRQQFEGAAEGAQRLGVGKAARRLASGLHVPGCCLLRLLRRVIVAGDQGGKLIAAPAAQRHLFQPLGGQPVIAAPRALEHAAIGHVAHERVFEQVFLRALKAGDGPRKDQLALVECIERRRHVGWRRGRRLRAQIVHRLVPEDAAHDGGLLQGGAGVVLQAVQACLQNAVEGLRQPHLLQTALINRPRLHAGVNHPVLDQHLDDLFHKEGVAVGGGGDLLDQLRRDVCRWLQQGQQQAACVGSRKLAEFDPLHVPGVFPPGRPALGQFRPRRADQQQPSPPAPAVEAFQEVERAVVRPVQVFDQRHHRAVGGEGGEIVGQPGDGLVLQHLRVVHQRAPRRVVGGEAEQPPDQRRRVRLSGQHALDGAAQLAFDGFGRIAVLDAELFRKEVAQQPIGCVRQAAQAAPDKDLGGRSLAAYPALELQEDAALAQPGVADQRNQPARLGGKRVPPRLMQGAEDLVAANQGCGRGGAVDLQRHMRPLTHNAVIGDWLLKALDRRGRVGFQGKLAADMLQGVVRDDDAIHRSKRLQAARQVDGVAYDDEILAAAFAQGADHCVPGVDTGAHLQPHAVLRLEAAVEQRQFAAHCQRRTHGLDGVEVGGLDQAKDRHDGVAGKLLDHAAVALDGRRPAREVGVDDLAHIFGVQPARERGEVHQVSKENGDQAALFGAGLGLQMAQAVAQGGQGGVDDGVAQQVALSLQRFNGVLDFADLLHGKIGCTSGTEA